MTVKFSQWAHENAVMMTIGEDLDRLIEEYSVERETAERTQATIDIICAMNRVGIEFIHKDWPRDKPGTVGGVLDFVAGKIRDMESTQAKEGE